MLQIVYIWYDVKFMPSVYTFTNMTSPWFLTKMRKAIYRNIPYVLWIWYDTLRVNHWLCVYIYIYVIYVNIYIYIYIDIYIYKYIYICQNWICHIGNANQLVLRDEILTKAWSPQGPPGPPVMFVDFLNPMNTTWWFIPLSKWVTTPVISGLTLLIPFITGVITHLLSGMSHQV